MTAHVLIVLLGGEPVGRVERTQKGELRFSYDESYRGSARAVPLSLSMPLSSAQHPHQAIHAFLWGLLPDNEQTVERWARRFHVSPRSVLALLSHVGEDCAGAVQLAREERVSRLLTDAEANIAWLNEDEIAARLRALREDHAAGRSARDTGQFSLAGAQPKTALLFQNGRWGVPSGRMPTTHILKPPTGQLDGYAENEHFCLRLARALGLPTASSEVRVFGNEKAFVVERYDRVQTTTPAARTKSKILRLHQEDMCQALAVEPTRKYQNEGGPSPALIARLLVSHSSEGRQDLLTLLDALLFNWLIAGTDAHAKNYSLLLAARGRVRLAPLYDLSSALPYPELDQRRLKLAMKLGATYRVRDIAARNVTTLAKELGLDTELALVRARALAETMRAQVQLVAAGVRADGLNHPIVDRLEKQIDLHARRCLSVLG